MPDENKKPEVDEVSDEQLEDVAGGVDVFANNRGLNLKSSVGGDNVFADVNDLAPEGGSPIPIPYPADSNDGSSSGNPPGSPSGD